MREDLIAEVAKVPGVAKAEGELWSAGGLVIDGEFKRSAGGGGTIISTSSSEPFNPASNVDGRMPQRGPEVALLRDTAEKHNLALGDRVGIATRGGIPQVTIVGVYDLGSANAGGTDVVSAPLAEIQHWFDRAGEVTSVNVAAEDGVAPAELVRRIREVLPPELDVRTGDAAADETANEINDQIGSFLTPALLAFAGAALLVGAFIIFNTFTITVAERTREFALLRTLGATRGQILAAVALQALVIGLVASALGIALGLLFAIGLASMFETVGLGLPTGGLELSPRTTLLSLLVGVGVTQVAAMPRPTGTRVPPIAALPGRRWTPRQAALVDSGIRGCGNRHSGRVPCCGPAGIGTGGEPPVDHGARRGPAVRWRRPQRSLVRPAARRRGRLAAGAPLRRARSARARERHAQPGPDRHDGRRAHGRSRARGLRRRVRERDQGFVRQDGRPGGGQIWSFARTP